MPRGKAPSAAPTPEQLQRGRDFAEWLKAAIARAGTNPHALSQKTGHSASYLYYLTKDGLDSAGRYKHPGEDLIEAIAKATGASVADGRRAAGYDPGDLPDVPSALATLPKSVQLVLVEFIERLKASGQIAAADDMLFVPVVGVVSAGSPILTGAHIREQLAIPRHMVRAESSDAHFALRVRGDSLLGLHIVEGDTIIFRQTDRAQDGDIAAVVTAGGRVAARRFRQHPQTLKRWVETVPFTGTPAISEIGDPSPVIGVKVGLYRVG